MLYQKLLVGKQLFFLSSGKSTSYPLHRHGELELSFCLKGSYKTKIKNEVFILNEGDLLFIPPEIPHEFFEVPSSESFRLTIELGPVFLGEHYIFFANSFSSGKLFHLKEDENSSFFKELFLLLENTAFLYQSRPRFSDLQIKSNLYSISILLLKLFAQTNSYISQKRKSFSETERIEKALNIIYENYASPLNIDYICKECGYSKSTFCRIFKRITGDTFHSVLNKHRVEIACILLETTNNSIEEIAICTGFTDSKSFCRVFGSLLNESPGTFRKKKNSLKN